MAACSTRITEIGREPALSAPGRSFHVNAGEYERIGGGLAPVQKTDTTWNEARGQFFRDVRARNPGDIITIDISIDDRATLGNQSNRSKESKVENSVDYLLKFLGIGSSGAGSLDINSSSSSAGKGNVQRSERIRMSLAGIVVQTFPNGNMLISGSQEIRVNFEMRVLTIVGIVKPQDISKDNRVPYDKIAEARVSYGGRGRLTEVQQPQLGQQVYDLVRPF